MATPAAYLSVVVEATTAGATRNLRAVQTELQHTGKGATLVEGNSKRMSGALNESGKSASRAHSSFASLAKGVLAAGGAFAAYELAKGAITDTEELVSATIKLSAATGLDAKTASSWIEVMKARGVESTAVALGFITLEHNIRNAEGGSKSAQLAFTQLGVPMSDIKKQNLQQTILEIADAFQKSKSPTQRAAIAQQLFGRNAKVLIPILAQGSQGIKDALAAAQRYGAYLPNNIKQLKQAHEAQLNLNYAMDGLKIAFTQAVLPALVAGAKHVLAFVGQMRSGKGVGGEFAKAISTAFDTIKGVVKKVIDLSGGLANFVKILSGIGVAILAMKAFNVASSAVQAFGLALADPEIALAIAAIAAASYLIVKNWKTIGPFFKGVASDIGPALSDAFHWVVRAANDAAHWLVTAFKDAKKFLAPVLDGIGSLIGSLISGFKSLLPSIGPALHGIGNVVKIVFGPIVSIIGHVTKWVLPALGDAFKAVVKVAGTVFKTLAGITSGGFKIIKGIIDVFAGLFTLKFTRLWHGIEGIFSGAVKVQVEIVKGIWGQMKNAAVFIMHAIRDGIKGAWPDVVNAFVGFINDLLDPINFVLKLVGLNPLNQAPTYAGSGKSAGTASKGTPIGGHTPAHATGGIATRPGYFAGEEGPLHPEFILATNPRYRRRNLELWRKAGHVLGAPGFAQGGSPHFFLGGVWNAITSTLSQITGVQGAGQVASSLLHLGLKPLLSAFEGLLPSPQRGLPPAISGVPFKLLDDVANWGPAIITAATGGGPVVLPRHAQGGVVNSPGYFAGEDAPLHPEVILATNPAYRQRNQRLWAQAGSMLGMPTLPNGGYHDNSTTNITVHVSRDADIGKVADVIDRTTGSHLHARLRSAGLRGT